MARVRELNEALVGAKHSSDGALEAYVIRLKEECLRAALDAGHSPCAMPDALVETIVRASEPGLSESSRALKNGLLASSLL